VFVDCHVHLDAYPDPAEAAAGARRAGVDCVAVTETPARFVDLRPGLAGPGVAVALGVHPLHAGGLDEADLARFDALAEECDHLGEVGLDGSPDGVPTLNAQRRAFARVLAHPRAAGRLLTVHSRGAEAEVVAALARAGVTAVLHWYRGTPAQAAAAAEAGLFFSVNPAMLASGEGRALVDCIPPERVLTETDGPYTEVDGRTSLPADIPAVVSALAERWGVDAESARRRVWGNWAAARARAGVA
jgi:TatD DNase family protein